MTMKRIVEELLREPQVDKKLISKEDYDQWARGFIFEGLRNQRYGQSFCNYFDIQDNILYYANNVADADRYIQKNYLK